MSTVAFPIRLVRKIVRENVRGTVRDSVRERVCEQRHERRRKKKLERRVEGLPGDDGIHSQSYLHSCHMCSLGDGKDASRVEGNGEVAIHLADARWDPIASGEGGSSEMRCDATPQLLCLSCCGVRDPEFEFQDC